MTVDVPNGTMTQRAVAPRGVYRMRERYKGRWIYYAWSSRGEVLDIWRPRRGETDAEIVWGLATLLRLEDRRHLRLHRATRLDVSDLRSSSSPSSERRPA